MPSKKYPTNQDLMQKLDSIVKAQESMNTRLVDLEQWRIAVEAAKEALKEYQLSHAQQEPKNDSISNKALAAVIATLITLGGVITVIITKL